VMQQRGCLTADRVSLCRQLTELIWLIVSRQLYANDVLVLSRIVLRNKFISQNERHQPKSEIKRMAPDRKEQIVAEHSSLLSAAWSMLREMW
jgi:hypothetical protein